LEADSRATAANRSGCGSIFSVEKSRAGVINAESWLTRAAIILLGGGGGGRRKACRVAGGEFDGGDDDDGVGI